MNIALAQVLAALIRDAEDLARECICPGKRMPMPRSSKLILSQPIKERFKTFKVRLDERTVITLSTLEALTFWKQRYPKAQVIG